MSTNVAGVISISAATLAADGKTLTVTLTGNTGTMSPGSPTGWFVFANGIFVNINTQTMNTANGVNTIVLKDPIRSGQEVRLRYDFTSVSGTQITDSSTAPGFLAYYDNYPVTNNSAVTSTLTLSAPATNAAGTQVTFTIVGSTGTINLSTELSAMKRPWGFQFVVGANAAVIPVSSVSVSGTTITCNLMFPVTTSDTLKYLYDYRGASQVWDSAGTVNSLGNVTSLTTVTNNSTLVANFFRDTFNGTNGSNLSAHTPDVGTSWTAAATSFIISNGAQSGTATTLFVHNATFPGVSTNLMTAVGTPATTNYRITTDLYLKTVGNYNSTVYARSNAGATIAYSLSFNPNSKVLTLSKIGGSFPGGSVNTYTMPFTFIAGQTYTLGIEIIDGYIHDSRGGGSITGYSVTAAGSGYTTDPTVTVNGGNGNGVSAQATVGRTANTVTSLVPKTGQYWGSGYYEDPTVSFSGGGGSGATATSVRSQGQPCAIISCYVVSGSQQALTTPVIQVFDSYSPIQTAGAILISAVNDGPSNGAWFANFRVDYMAHGFTPVAPQYQQLLQTTDSAYPYSTVSFKMLSLPALDGVPPYSYSLYQNTVRSRASETLISALGASPSLLYTDTPAPQTAKRFYYYIVTDTAGQVDQAFQRPNGVTTKYPQWITAQRDAPLSIFFIGDSETTSGLFAPTVYAVLARKKAPRTVNGVSEGVVTAITFPTYVQGTSGITSGALVPGQSGYNTAVASIKSLKCSVVSIMVGANDVRDGQNPNSWITPTQYGTNIGLLVNGLLTDCGVGAGFALTNVIVQFPYTAAPGSYANGNVWLGDSVSRIGEYEAQITALDNGTTIFAGDNNLDAFFGTSPQFYADGVHPSSPTAYGSFNGQQWMGVMWGLTIASKVWPETVTQVSGTTSQIHSGFG